MHRKEIYMYDLVKVAPSLINAILKYKKKKKIEEVSDILIDYYDETPENFSKILLFGYLKKSVKKIKIFVEDFNPNSPNGSSALEKIKEELKTFFYLLIEIISRTDLPIDKEPKKKGLLEEYAKLKRMSAVQFYNTCLTTLKLPEKEKEIQLDKEKKDKEVKVIKSGDEIEEKDILSSLLIEEKITLGYFLIIDDLYREESRNKDYFWEPFYQESYPPNYSSMNSRHDNLIRALYPQDSVFKSLEVIKSLISQNLLDTISGNWSKSGKTYYLSTLTVNDQLALRDTIYHQIIKDTSNLISKLIKSVAEDNKIMMGLYLLEQNIPEESVEKLIGSEMKKLIEFGFNNQDNLTDSWRIMFNASNDQFNMVEVMLTKNSLHLISRIREFKQSLLNTLNELEKHYISMFSVGKSIIDKYMGENYKELTLRKYRAKMEEIELNYYKKLDVLVNYTGEKIDVFENIHKSLVLRGILWHKPEGFEGYADVHQLVVKSFIEIEPTTELKEELLKIK